MGTGMKHFVARVQKSGRTYYYFACNGKPRREIPLGSDYVAAARKWAELIGHEQSEVADFAQLANKYDAEVIPTKAKSTQATNRSDLKHLRAFFCTPTPAPLEQIKPAHIFKLLERHKATPTTANRLKRLFSHMFNMARNWGYTERENPVQGVEGHELDRRDYDVSEVVYKSVWLAGSDPLRDCMDLAYLTGQRPGDTLKLTERNIEGGLLIFRQGKTRKKMRMRIVGELSALLERIAKRKATYKVWSACLTVNTYGLPMTKQTLRTSFEDARETAARAADAELAKQIRAMWFYDLRAKAADDVAERTDEQAAADQLGHKNVATTRTHYLRRGKLVGPTK
jgi:integrase